MTPLPLTSGQLEQEAEGKIRKLKRSFFELDEETRSEVPLSGERNVRMREERENSNEKIQGLENGQSHSNGFPMVGSSSSVVPVAQPSSTTQPHKSLNPQGRTSSVANLREAMTDDGPDDEVDLLSTSRHLGPQIRRREEDARRGREGDKDRDVLKTHRRESSHSEKGGPAAMDYSAQSQARDDSPVPTSNSGHHTVSPTSASRGPPSSRSKSLSHHQSHIQPRLSTPDNDVSMSDATAPVNNSTTSSNSNNARETPQKSQGHDSSGGDPSAPGSSTRAKGVEAGPPRRSSRQNKGRGSSAIAAAAAADVTRQQASPRKTSNFDAQQDVQTANRISSTNPSLKTSKNSSPSTKGTGAINPTAPSMENIIKVAAAAVAAQNAAAASATANTISSSSSQSHQIVDPNLDPSLFSNKGAATSKNFLAVDTKATSSGSNSGTNSASTPSTTTATSSLSNNPYLSLSMLAKQSSGSATPSGHQMVPMHSHPMYYPPNTPVTPNTPTYPIYSNPYYYLAGPMVPGPNGMFPPPPAAAFPPSAQQQPGEPPRATKAKRLKAPTVTTKNLSIPMVPRDKNGKPMLPLNVGIMTVINLGEVCMREHFHTERYIFPVGYEVTRRYLSTIDPGIEVVYHCTILDGGDGPKFQIIPSDRADKPIIAGTATGAWSSIVKQANAIRNRQHSNSVSGPDFFGLGQNTIKHLIQELANSDRLRDYVWQNFVEGGPLGGRHAAVIPALPEEYDASMPIGAYYPKREMSANPGVPRGLSHYPQHIIAQAEAQKGQQATQQTKERGATSAGPSSSSIPQQQEGNTLSQNATQDNHVQIVLPPVNSAKGLTIQHYQPPQQKQATSQGHEKRASRSTNSNSSASGRITRTSIRGSQRQAQQQQQQQIPASAPGTSSASEAMPTTFVGIMSQFPVPGLADTPHPGGS